MKNLSRYKILIDAYTFCNYVGTLNIKRANCWNQGGKLLLYSVLCLICLLKVLGAENHAFAGMTTTGSETVCIGDLNNTDAIGNGTAAYDSKTITIGDNITETFVRRTNGDTVISLRNKNTVTIKNKTVVQGHKASNSGGHLNLGPNVIEFDSHNTLTVDAGATVQQIGATTNGEPINTIGFGNTITNYGTLHNANGAVIWFEDRKIAANLNERNKVVNYGTISTDKGHTQNVIGTSMFASGPGLIFENYGTIKGSLSFAGGDDSLTFGTGSHITGNVNGGGGTNDLTLDANLGEAEILGTIANFASLTKTGAGTWSVLGGSASNNTLTKIGSVLVKEGLLNIVGTAPQFTGSVQIDSSGSLKCQAAGINNTNSVINNGTLIFIEPNDASYTGQAITGSGMVIKQGNGNLTMTSVAANTYSGGTWLSAGGLIVNKDSDLGAPTGGLILGSDTVQGTASNGMLQLNAAFDLAATRAITIRDGGGTINTNGHNTAISQNINGTGSLSKTGDGILALHGDNSYGGGTVVKGGTLALNSDKALGAGTGALELYNQTTLQLDGDVLMPGRTVVIGNSAVDTTTPAAVTINTNGFNGNFHKNISEATAGIRIDKTGDGILALHGDNSYSGGTLVKGGTLAINSNKALGAETGALELYNQTTLQLDGDVLMPGRTVVIGNSAVDATTPAAVTINTNGFNGEFHKNISEAIVVTRMDKTGDGILALYGDNNYRGGTVIANGAVAVKSVKGTGSGDIYLGTHGQPTNTSGTLRFDGDVDYETAAHSGAIFINDGGGTLDTGAFTGTLYENMLKNGSADTNGNGGGAGSLHKTGNGVLVTLGNQLYSGATFVTDGVFRLDALDSSNPAANTKGLLNTSAMNIAQGARLEGIGLVGNGNTLTTNSGAIAPGIDCHGNQLFTSLTLNGDYKANDGAVVEIGSQLMGDASPRSTLVINGQITADSAVTGVKVINLGGGGDVTNVGIQIIKVLGSADHAAVGQKFRLLSDFTAPNGQPAVVAGAYAYILEADYDYDYVAGSYNTNAAGMFLRNYKKANGTNALNPSTPLYEAYALVLGNSNNLPSLEQRVGHRNWLKDTDRQPLGQSGVWLRQEGGHGVYKPLKGSGSGTKYNLDYARVNLGFDYPVIKLNNNSVLVGGINLDFGWSKAKVRSDIGKGTINTTNYGAGFTLTWYDISDFYIDSQARYNWYSSDIKSSAINSAKYQINANAGDGYAFSLEVGQIFELDDIWSITPQAQLMYSETSFDSFIDTQNTKVANPKGYRSLVSRLGVALNYEKSYENGGQVSRTKFYGLPNYYHEFIGDSTVSLADVKYESEFNKDWLGLTMGVSRNWDNDKYSLYGEVGVKSSINDLGNEYEFTVEAGLCRYF